jgi:hypothetical protein
MDWTHLSACKKKHIKNSVGEIEGENDNLED